MTQPRLPLGAVMQPITLADTMRDAWLSRSPVCVRLTGCLVAMVVGKVSHVAVTGTWATVDGWHIPLDRVLVVESPSHDDVETYAHLMHDLRERVKREDST